MLTPPRRIEPDSWPRRSAWPCCTLCRLPVQSLDAEVLLTDDGAVYDRILTIGCHGAHWQVSERYGWGGYG